jgi:hypothetical protein
MRKLTLIVVAAVACIAASIAVADGFEGAKSAKSASATFTATTASATQTKTCTTSDGKTLAITHATYTGTSAGGTEFAGNAKLSVHALINTTDDIGTVSGSFAAGTTHGAFEAVYDHGKIAGFAEGRAGEGIHLLGNLSAGFSATGGFTGGMIGGGTAGGSAVELGPGKCQEAKPERSQAEGTVTAVSAKSITVAGLTCNVADAAKVANVKVGDRVAISCTVATGTTTPTLDKLGPKSKH